MTTPSSDAARSQTPVVTDLRVIPVAGHDGMLMNLSGAHGPFFTRNLLILKDSAGRTGVARCPAARRSARRWKTRAASSSASRSAATTRC